MCLLEDWDLGISIMESFAAVLNVKVLGDKDVKQWLVSRKGLMIANPFCEFWREIL